MPQLEADNAARPYATPLRGSVPPSKTEADKKRFISALQYVDHAKKSLEISHDDLRRQLRRKFRWQLPRVGLEPQAVNDLAETILGRVPANGLGSLMKSRMYWMLGAFPWLSRQLISESSPRLIDAHAIQPVHQPPSS